MAGEVGEKTGAKSPKAGSVKSPANSRVTSPARGAVKSPKAGTSKTPADSRVTSPARGAVKNKTEAEGKASIKSPRGTQATKGSEQEAGKAPAPKSKVAPAKPKTGGKDDEQTEKGGDVGIAIGDEQGGGQEPSVQEVKGGDGYIAGGTMSATKKPVKPKGKSGAEDPALLRELTSLGVDLDSQLGKQLRGYSGMDKKELFRSVIKLELGVASSQGERGSVHGQSWPPSFRD